MIISFGDKATEALFHRDRSKRILQFPANARRAAVQKFDVLNAAQDLEDLRSPPGNRLEVLKGDLRGFHSIRVNDQWRLVFRWADGSVCDLRLVD